MNDVILRESGARERKKDCARCECAQECKNARPNARKEKHKNSQEIDLLHNIYTMSHNYDVIT